MSGASSCRRRHLKLPPHHQFGRYGTVPMPKGTLMLIGDQGFGDTINFCRYIPQVLKLCPNILMACSKEMRPLLMQQQGITRYYDRWQDIPSFQAYAPLSGLPRLFHTDLSNIPGNVPYLKAEPAKAESWRKRLDRLAPRGYRRIGLVWAGRPTHGNDFNRSMNLEKLAPLTEHQEHGLHFPADGSGPGRARPVFRHGATDQSRGRNH